MYFSYGDSFFFVITNVKYRQGIKCILFNLGNFLFNILFFFFYIQAAQY